MNIFKRLLKITTAGILVLFLSISASLSFVSGQSRAAADIDEIVVVGTDGYVYVYDYTGAEVYKSDEGGWSYVATGDLNNDGDDEIVAVSGGRVKVYDPQIKGTEVKYDVTYSGGGTFTKVGTGKLVGGDSAVDIALIRSLGGTVSRIIIYQLSSNSPAVDTKFDLTDWNNFAIGDYDGDGDDDFALTYWKGDYPSGNRNWFELRKGHAPDKKLQDSNNAGVYNNSQWFDLAAGEFFNDSKNATEWVGAQNLGNNIAVQRWDSDEKDIDSVWSLSTAFNFVTAYNFRGDPDVDQIGMLRNVNDGSVSLQFARGGDSKFKPWSSISGLGTGWLNFASGNLDDETTYGEAVILRSDLIRVFLRPHAGQNGESAYLNCNTPGNCLDISGSFNGSLAVGDLGEDFSAPNPPADYEVTPTRISRTAAQSETIAGGTFYVYGDVASELPLEWSAAILPAFDSQKLLEDAAKDSSLKISISGNKLQYQGVSGAGTLPLITWMTLDQFNGTTPATVTTSFSSTNFGSPLYPEGAYKAIIFVWRKDVQEDRFRYIDVTVLRPSHFVYMPLVIK